MAGWKTDIYIYTPSHSLHFVFVLYVTFKQFLLIDGGTEVH